MATTVWCFERGAAIVRVHDVASLGARAAALLDVMERAHARRGRPDGVVAA